ncbi:MAG: DUF2497 domain-containing protein [Alphaproteobacteria bacterium HGW-Alphaproteobacteria-16]|nr:MAG: DUF2497 domain-containing protein [Alphaproteobacteria bacterium HGW-Alphaproteobacteria-16]
MEDILSSIKRIIAEEGDTATASRPRRAARPASPPPVEDDEILELREPVPDQPARPGPIAVESPPVAPQPVAAAAEPEPAPISESILSQTAAEAMRGPLEQLSRLVVKPDVPGSDTLEGMVRDMLRPMLRDWLDANLPRMVEDMVQREIARITARRD